MEPDKFHDLISQPYKPYYFLEPLTGPGPLEAYFRNLIDNAPNLITTSVKGHLVAVGSWSDSPWDSCNTNYKTARIHFFFGKGKEHAQDYQKIYQEMEAEFISKGYEYILFRANASNLLALQTAQNNGFQVVDGLLLLTSEDKHHIEPSFRARVAVEGDLPAIKEIARNSFIFDRFHTDPAIPDTLADELHANWIYDSFTKNTDERVLVEETDGKITGLLSYSMNEALSSALGVKIMTIILLATHFRSRNQGRAKSLIQESLRIAHQESFDTVLVGTQLRNVRATRLYEKLGFRITDSSYTLRKLLKGKPL